jgi:MFS family permease
MSTSASITPQFHQRGPRDAEKSDLETFHIEEAQGDDTRKTHTAQDPIVACYPEGGRRAWLAVAGATAMLFVGGLEYGFGVFLTYYITHNLRNYTSSQISWIGSVTGFTHTTVGLISGKLYDDGYFRHLICGGSLLYVFCIMMLSLCTKYYQIWLAQGPGMGIATGIVYQPALTVVGQYFERRRSLVTGIAFAGAQLGGVVIPIIVDHLFAEIGFGWGTRIIGFIVLLLLIFACFAMTTRLPSMRRGTATVHHDDGDTTENNLDPGGEVPKI